MDWFKVKVEHILNSPLSDEEIGRLMKLQALVSLKERHPSDAEISTVLRLKTVDKLAEKLASFGENLPLIVEKVLEDVVSYRTKDEKNRVKTRERVQKYREKIRPISRLIEHEEDGDVTRYVTRYCNADVTPPCNAHVTHREEKRREERRGENINTEAAARLSPAPVHVHEAASSAAAFSGKFLGGEKQPPLTDLPEDAESLIEEKTKIREADKSKAALKNRESYKADLRKALRENPDEIIAWREMSKKRKLDAAVADQKKLDEEIRRKADDEMRKSISEKHDRFFALLKQFDKLAKLERQRIDDRVTQKYLANNPEAKKLSGMRFNPRSRMLAVELLPYYEEIFEEYEYQFEPK